jgi:hypothetical protein
MPRHSTKTTKVVAYPKRDRHQYQRFSFEYNAGILADVDACACRGDVGALLRREGLYCSHVNQQTG